VIGAVAHSGEAVDDRCTVAVDARGGALSIELLYPADGMEPSVTAAAERFGSDAEAIQAAARSALAAPDRQVLLEVGARAS